MFVFQGPVQCVVQPGVPSLSVTCRMDERGPEIHRQREKTKLGMRAKTLWEGRLFPRSDSGLWGGYWILGEAQESKAV